MDFDLNSVTMLTKARSRSISAENPTGAKGGGAKVTPSRANPASSLGVGWKVRPCIDLEGECTTTLANITGPGTLTHIWITAAEVAYQTCILRFYWDGETQPSVEVPLGDFFAIGHGVRYHINSLPVAVNPSGGFNCYWKMPFRKKCLITIENLSPTKVKGFFYQISYELDAVPLNRAYFHAQWRGERATTKRPVHTILDGVRGRGNYVGTFISWVQHLKGWWGEGEVKFYLDGDKEFPTICGTGTEDYFGGAWCFGKTYSTAFLGYPLWIKGRKIQKHTMYRWHILDPIKFSKDLRVTIQALGWYPHGKFRPLEDDIISVAYWYQNEPHAPFPKLPPMNPGRRRS